MHNTIAVYCEGTETELEYLEAIKRLPQYAGTLAVQYQRTGVMPWTAVVAAKKDKVRGTLDVDEYWCIFDVESPKEKEHPRIRDARQMATDNGIHVAVSNPCFELWLLLHFREQTAYLTTERAERERSIVDGSSGKHLEPSTYVPRRHDAIRRAEALRRKHADDGTAFPHDNPSTTFDELLTHIEDLVTNAE